MWKGIRKAFRRDERKKRQHLRVGKNTRGGRGGGKADLSREILYLRHKKKKERGGLQRAGKKKRGRQRRNGGGRCPIYLFRNSS